MTDIKSIDQDVCGGGLVDWSGDFATCNIDQLVMEDRDMEQLRWLPISPESTKQIVTKADRIARAHGFKFLSIFATAGVSAVFIFRRD